MILWKRAWFVIDDECDDVVLVVYYWARVLFPEGYDTPFWVLLYMYAMCYIAFIKVKHP